MSWVIEEWIREVSEWCFIFLNFIYFIILFFSSIGIDILLSILKFNFGCSVVIK